MIAGILGRKGVHCTLYQTSRLAVSNKIDGMRSALRFPSHVGIIHIRIHYTVSFVLHFCWKTFPRKPHTYGFAVRFRGTVSGYGLNNVYYGLVLASFFK